MKNINAHNENPDNQHIHLASNHPYCCPLSSTTCIEKSHNIMDIIPTISGFLTFTLAGLFITLQCIRTTENILIGIFIINNACQQKLSTK